MFAVRQGWRNNALPGRQPWSGLIPDKHQWPPRVQGKPLPAYAVTFCQPAHATVYVAAQLGTVQSVRTDPWRIFDVLWMLHTMDYEGRDDRNAGPHQ